jgi:hypothetical protein
LDWKIQVIQSQCEDLRAELVESIASGGSTGKHLRDFILLVGNGNFDPVVFQEYQSLIRLCQKKSGQQRVLIVQRSEYFSEEDERMVTITNHHLTHLRPVRPRFKLNTLQIKLSVERHGLFVGEVHHVETGERQVFPALLNQTSLCIGPLESFNTPIGSSRTDDNHQWFLSPADAVSTIIPLPISGDRILTEYEVDPQDLATYHRLWMREKARLRRR